MDIKSIDRRRTKIAQQKKINDLIDENETLKNHIEKWENLCESLHNNNNKLKMDTVEKWKFDDLEREFKYLEVTNSHLQKSRDVCKEDNEQLKYMLKKSKDYGHLMTAISLSLLMLGVLFILFK